MWTARVGLVFVLILPTAVIDAQKIFIDPSCSMMSETTVHEIVKNVLMSNFAFPDNEIRRTMSVKNQQTFSRSDESVLISLNERVLKLEEEMKTMKDILSAKGNSDIELVEQRTRVHNLSQHVENLESRIATLFQETGSVINILPNENLTDLSTNMKKLQMTLNGTELKIADLVKNVSFSQLNLDRKLNTSVQDVKHALLMFKEDYRETLEKRLNESISVTQEQEQSRNKKLSSFKNLTEKLDDAKGLFELEVQILNTTVFLLQKKVQNLEDNNTKLTNEIIKATMSEVKQNMSETMDLSLSRVNKILFTETAGIKNHVEDIVQNVSRLNDHFMLHSEFTTNLNRSLNNILAEVLEYKHLKRNISLIGEELKSSFEVQLESSISNFTSIVQQIEDTVFSQLEKERLDNEKAIEPLKEMINVKSEEMFEIFNETNSQIIQVKSELKRCNKSFVNVKNQSDNVTILLLEIAKTVKANMSFFNDSLYKTIKDSELHNQSHLGRLNQFTGNLSNMQRKVEGLESISYGQTSRISLIENQITNISASLASVKTDIASLNTGVRLVNGGPLSGRVEIFHSGTWGTVCDDAWDNNDARVVCRMLGLREGTARSTAAFGQGTGTIWLDEVNCQGSELSIFACSLQSFGQHDCSHGEDAGVVCT